MELNFEFVPLKCLQFRQTKNFFGLFTLLLCLILIPNGSLASPILCSRFYNENTSLKDVEKRLGRRLTISLHDPAPETNSPSKRYKLALKPFSGGTSLGNMTFRYDSHQNTLHVDNITVYSEYKRHGVSLALLEEAIKVNDSL